MNLHIVEKGLKVWLEAEGVTVPVHTGITHEEIPPEAQIVSCYCPSSEHVIGPLYKANVQIIIATPPHADAGDDRSASLGSHSALITQVEGLVDGYAGNSLRTEFDTETGYTFSGLWKPDGQGAPDSGRWVHTINIQVGVQTS